MAFPRPFKQLGKFFRENKTLDRTLSIGCYVAIGSCKKSLNGFRPTLRRANEFYVNSKGFDLFVRAGLAATIVMSAWRKHKNLQEKNDR
ncbi:hypothetical protein OROGR_028680 [Orobanche gracilis]